jgi:hypothetical protein
MNTKLAEWAAVGELIGAVAIVLSLVFVGLEIRGNTQATQAATFQEHMGYEIQILSDVAADPELMRAFNTAWDDIDSLTDSERTRRQAMTLATMRLWEGFYLQYLSGTLSDEGWTSREPVIRRWVTEFPDGTWPDGVFSGAFRDYIARVRSSARE